MELSVIGDTYACSFNIVYTVLWEKAYFIECLRVNKVVNGIYA